jgi:hypothetical protein
MLEQAAAQQYFKIILQYHSNTGVGNFNVTVLDFAME